MAVPNEENALLAAALRYAEQFGFAVFPCYELNAAGTDCACPRTSKTRANKDGKNPQHRCTRPAKHPRTANGFKDATTDSALIRRWWRQWPRANIGIATEPSRLTVLDIDTRNGGDFSLHDLEQQHGSLPLTPRVLTGSGGGSVHYYYRGGGKSGALAEGIDVKSRGGYVIAPPSMHISGRAYVRDLGADLDETPLAEMPDWVAKQLATNETEKHYPPSGCAVLEGFLGLAFAEAGWLLHPIGENRAAARCPWEHEHTSGTRGDSSTVVFAPVFRGGPGAMWCSHSHCGKKRSYKDVLIQLPETAIAAARARLLALQPPPMPDEEDRGEEGVEAAETTTARAVVTTAKKLPARWMLFDDKGHFVPAVLGEWLKKTFQTRVGHDGQLWRYDKGVYRPSSDGWAREITRHVVGKSFRRNQLEEIKAYLHAETPSLGHDQPREYINCANGLLHWATGVPHDHSPEVLSTNQIPIEWHAEATAPTILRVLGEILPEDCIDLVLELSGYALYPANPFRKAVLLYGKGGNGKSMLLKLITALLGEMNVSSVPLQTMGEDRFSAADIYGKLANICGDLDARAIDRTDLFKQITGGDPIRAQRKFRDPFSFTCYALPLFSANELPRTQDQTDAWHDRWIPIPFPYRFEGTKEEDTELIYKMKLELEGFFVLAITGLQRLMRRGRFALPESVMMTKKQYRETSDTVQGFVIEECIFDPEKSIDRAELYRKYRAWCLDGGKQPLANTGFNTRLIQTYHPRVYLQMHVGRPTWRGIWAGGVEHAKESGGNGGGPGDSGDVGDVLATLLNRGKKKGEKRGGKVEEGKGGITNITNVTPKEGGGGVPYIPNVPAPGGNGTDAAPFRLTPAPPPPSREPGEDDTDDGEGSSGNGGVGGADLV